jgi:hypothetical protein
MVTQRIIAKENKCCISIKWNLVISSPEVKFKKPSLRITERNLYRSRSHKVTTEDMYTNVQQKISH